MRYFIVLLCLGFLTKAQDEVEWTQDYRLVYNDFRGAIPAGTPKDTKATTFSVIEADVKQVGQDIHAYIRTLFKYNASWMRSESRNDYTLKHEQGHFDISEIYSRKIRKKLSGIKVKRKGGEYQITKVCTKFVKQHRKAQKKYDDATSYSIREKNQAEYIKKIEKDLKELEDYKDPRVVMRFR